MGALVVAYALSEEVRSLWCTRAPPWPRPSSPPPPPLQRLCAVIVLPVATVLPPLIGLPRVGLYSPAAWGNAQRDSWMHTFGAVKISVLLPGLLALARTVSCRNGWQQVWDPAQKRAYWYLLKDVRVVQWEPPAGYSHSLAPPGAPPSSRQAKQEVDMGAGLGGALALLASAAAEAKEQPSATAAPTKAATTAEKTTGTAVRDLHESFAYVCSCVAWCLVHISRTALTGWQYSRRAGSAAGLQYGRRATVHVRGTSVSLITWLWFARAVAGLPWRKLAPWHRACAEVSLADCSLADRPVGLLPRGPADPGP